MQEILFRAKDENEVWQTGYYVCLKDLSKNRTSHRIYTGFAESEPGEFFPEWIEVDPETVARYTGFQDANGRAVFEGDHIVHCTGSEIGVIRYGEYRNAFNDNYGGHIGFYVEWKEGADADILRKDLGYWISGIRVISD